MYFYARTVASLRRLLGEDPKNSTYIAAVPRLGYRAVAEVRWGTQSLGRLVRPTGRRLSRNQGAWKELRNSRCRVSGPSR